ncbi:MAG: sugar/nucleoside kinase (ribokinase family) [Candidatus Poriferisodalaceae bacterium]|jgi:sugar/nucleoside kinase (ribokinase family)
MSQQIDVVGIGNALVDVLTHSTDEQIASLGMIKGAMNLIDAERSAELYALLDDRMVVPGGSAANTIIGVGSLGGTAGYVGRVADDDLGDAFIKDMNDLGITYSVPRAPAKDPTGRCIVFVTNDGERTLNTFLGASNGLTPADVDPAVIASGSIVFLEGYLWDPPEAKIAMRQAAAAVERPNRVALTLSDSFCVDRHRDSFLELIDDHVDILFANHHELMSLFQTDDLDEAMELVRQRVPLTAVTRSELGSVLIQGDETAVVAAEPVDQVVDATGAGDLYASGVLYGLARGYDLARCGRLGSIAAAEVISHVGPRPEKSLRDLVGDLA